MMSLDWRASLIESLWGKDPPAGERVFAILDGARDMRIFAAVDATRQDKCCLFNTSARWWPGDEIGWELVGVSPYLVEIEKGDAPSGLFLAQGWRHNWGILLRSDCTFDKLRRHFQSLPQVQTEAGRTLLFRYYDPRVLRIYLSSCRLEELHFLFEPLSTFVVPEEDRETALEYRFDGKQLVTSRIG